MTLFYPDVSAYEAGISLSGAAAACIKFTEGTSWLSSDWVPALGRAAKAGCWPFGYHFLHQGNGAGQAAWCHAHAAGHPLMLDWEPTGGSKPGVADAEAFTDAFRNAGGTCNLLYLPHWYWQQLGEPSLAPFAQRGMVLVSSNYTTYSDSGPGWAGYGGMQVAVWQYTSTHQFNGMQVDFNAYKGSLAQLKAVVGGLAHSPAQNWTETMIANLPTLIQGNHDTPGDVQFVHRLQALVKVIGDINKLPEASAVKTDGNYSQVTWKGVLRVQQFFGLAQDGTVGPKTWAALVAGQH
jgi:hypothetical protein